MISRRHLLAEVFPAALLVRALRQQGPQSAELSAVLARAAQYVATYEEQQLGNLLAAEDYVQQAELRSSGGRFVTSRQQRRTQADFLILLLGSARIGLRRVIRVDGALVKGKADGFEGLGDGSPQGLREQVAAIQKESSAYNIGPVQREINVPTFALAVARASEASRFSFEKHGERKIDGTLTWEVRFVERRSPTLTHGLRGESLLSSGALWIEPGSGRIWRTEFEVENPFSDPKVTGRIVVTYAANKSLGMLVPTEMQEHYESGIGSVDCTARYSNFRSFNVDVRSVIGDGVSR